mgnify:CR=1 FL=1
MFDLVKKELEDLGYKVYTNKVTNQRGDVLAEVNPYGTLQTKDKVIFDLVEKAKFAPVLEVEEKPKKKRSKK